MNRLRKSLASFWILAASFSNTVGRLASLGNEFGSAKPEAAAAAGVAAGTVGTAAAFMRGCRTVAREAPLLAGGAAGRTGFRLTEEVASTALSGSVRGSAEIDQLGIAVIRPSKWENFSPYVGKTNAAEGLAPGEVSLRWRADPEFRARALEEVAQRHPEQIRTVYDELLQGYRSPILLASQNLRPSLVEAIGTEPVTLYNSAGKPISGTVKTSVEAEYRAKAIRVFDEVLEKIPLSKYKSEEELRLALRKAFESQQRADYSLDVSTGKLKLKLKTNHGEITGEMNAYDVAKKLAAGSLGGWGAYQALTYKGEPSQGGATTPKKP